MICKANTVLGLKSDTIILSSFFLSGVTFGIGNLDSFPWHVVAIILFSQNKYKTIDLALILLAFVVLILTALSDIEAFESILYFRQLINYLSVMVGGAYLIVNPPDVTKTLKILLSILIVNILIGLLQNFSSIFAIFSNARIDIDGPRGTIGLFSEPTAFGLFSVFCFLYGYLTLKLFLPKQEKILSKIIILLSIFSICAVSRSSAAILILIIFFSLYALSNFKGFVLILLSIAYLAFVYRFYPETRIAQIVTSITSNDIFYLMATDGSINERASAVIGPYFGLLENYFFPKSAFSYHETYLNLRYYTDDFFWWGGGQKIMNFIGSFVYHLSFLGVVILIRYVFRNFNFKMGFGLLLVVLFYLSNSVPLSHGYPLLLFPAVYGKKPLIKSQVS